MKLKLSRKKLTQIVAEELKEAFPPGERQQRRKARTDEFFKDVAKRYSASSPENLGILKVAVEEYFQNNQLYGDPAAVSMRGFDEWFKERRSGYKKTAVQEIIKEETIKYLKEEASDCVKDYRLGGMTREEYCACLEHFGEQC